METRTSRWTCLEHTIYELTRAESQSLPTICALRDWLKKLWAPRLACDTNDLAVFTKMAPEKLCLGCGLRVDEPFAPIATRERKKLFYAALTNCLEATDHQQGWSFCGCCYLYVSITAGKQN